MIPKNPKPIRTKVICALQTLSNPSQIYSARTSLQLQIIKKFS